MKNSVTRFLNARKKSRGYPKYPRKPLDEILEYLRFTKVAPYIPKGAFLLDIGTGDGNFLDYLNGQIHIAVGIDPHLKQNTHIGNYHLIPGFFPDDYDGKIIFDVITILAAIEHIPMDVLPCVVKACWKYLKPGGQVIITVPHPRIDKLLELLHKLRIFEGFSTQQHYGLDPDCLPEMFKQWKPIKRERWCLGCNNLFIFEKSETH